MNRALVIATRRLPMPVEQRLAASYDARLNADDHAFSRDELAAALAEADALLCTITDRLDASLLDAPPRRARLLANFGVGTDHIDLAAARRIGIAVTNTPGVLTDDTADLALLLILAVARRAAEGEFELREARWPGWAPTYLLGTRVSGKTLGIVGFGRIGQALASRAHHGLSMHVRYYQPRPVEPEVSRAAGATPCATLDELLAESDFVSLHCPARPETFHLIGARALSSMKPDAFLINTARGDVIDERALIDALRGRVIRGAGLDVFEGEPAVSGDLKALDNVFLLPHLGSATLETRRAMGERALDNLDAFFAGRTPPDLIR